MATGVLPLIFGEYGGVTVGAGKRRNTPSVASRQLPQKGEHLGAKIPPLGEVAAKPTEGAFQSA
jgi:hypothetical protein